MEARIQSLKNVLERITSSKPRDRKLILKGLSSKEIKLICELCLNLINGNIPIKDRTIFAKFKRQRRIITDLADKRQPLKEKRKIINQKGGIIGTIAAAAIPIIVDSIYRLVQ